MSTTSQDSCDRQVTAAQITAGTQFVFSDDLGGERLSDGLRRFHGTLTNVGAIFRSAAALGIDAVLGHSSMRRPAVSAEHPSEHGRRLPGPVGASRGPAGSSTCGVSASRLPRWSSPTTRSTSTPSVPAAWTALRSCSARRVLGSCPRRSTPSTSPSRSRCGPASTRSTLPPRAPSSSGSSDPADPAPTRGGEPVRNAYRSSCTC